MTIIGVLNHEVDHALRFDTNKEQFHIDSDTPDKSYKFVEEGRIIQGSEQETARKLGEINAGEITHTNHLGEYYPTIGVTSTQRDNGGDGVVGLAIDPL